MALVTIIFSASLITRAGCEPKPELKDASKTTQKGSGSTVTQSEETLEKMELITGSASGSWVPVGAAIASKVNSFYKGFPLTAIPGPGSVGNPAVVSKGDAAFGLSYGPFLISANQGKAPYDSAMTNLRAIASLQPTVVHILASLDPSIKSINDVIEKKVPMKLGLPPVGNASNFLANIIFEAAGMKSASSLKGYGGDVYLGDGASLIDAWKDRHINAIFLTYNVPASAVSDALTGRNGRILKIDGSISEMLTRKFGFDKYVIKAGSYKGQTEDVPSVALPIVVFTTEKASESLVYNMTKFIHEGKEGFIKAHSSFNDFDPALMAGGTGIELHPGAIRYYKEIGLLK
jgi:uncharacterized protein